MIYSSSTEHSRYNQCWALNENSQPQVPEQNRGILALHRLGKGRGRIGWQNSRLMWRAWLGGPWRVEQWGLGSCLIHPELLPQGGHLEQSGPNPQSPG